MTGNAQREQMFSASLLEADSTADIADWPVRSINRHQQRAAQRCVGREK